MGRQTRFQLAFFCVTKTCLRGHGYLVPTVRLSSLEIRHSLFGVLLLRRGKRRIIQLAWYGEGG